MIQSIDLSVLFGTPSQTYGKEIAAIQQLISDNATRVKTQLAQDLKALEKSPEKTPGKTKTPTVTTTITPELQKSVEAAILRGESPGVSNVSFTASPEFVAALKAQQAQQRADADAKVAADSKRATEAYNAQLQAQAQAQPAKPAIGHMSLEEMYASRPAPSAESLAQNKEFLARTQASTARVDAQVDLSHVPEKVKEPGYVQPEPSPFETDGKVYMKYDYLAAKDGEAVYSALSFTARARTMLAELKGGVEGYDERKAKILSADYQASQQETIDRIKALHGEDGAKTFEKRIQEERDYYTSADPFGARIRELQSFFSVTSGSWPSKDENGEYVFNDIELKLKRPAPFSLSINQDLDVKVSAGGSDLSHRIGDMDAYSAYTDSRKTADSMSSTLKFLYLDISSYNTWKSSADHQTKVMPQIKDAYIALNGQADYDRDMATTERLAKQAESYERKIQEALQRLSNSYDITGTLPSKDENGRYVISDFTLSQSGGGYGADTPDTGWFASVSSKGDAVIRHSGQDGVLDRDLPNKLASIHNMRADNMTYIARTEVPKTELHMLHRGQLQSYYFGDGETKVRLMGDAEPRTVT